MCSNDEFVTYNAIFRSGSDDDDKQNSYSQYPEGEAMICDNNSCSHPNVLKLICTTCGQGVPEDYGFPFSYIMKDLRPSKTEAYRQRDIETNKILSKNKLILVLDLDHTLLESKDSEALTPDEKYLDDQIERDSLQDVSKVELSETYCYIVKLRPYVRRFLEQASTLFEMYAYTLSSRDYAKKMMNLLDPENRYFNSRLIAREDGTITGLKNLDVVLGQERAIVILDDNEFVWPMHNANLILVERYNYFAASQSDSGSKYKSLAEEKIDEDEGVMAEYFKILKKIHKQFFDPKVEVDVATRDVREVMRIFRIEILKGCKILVSHSYPDRSRCWLQNLAERMGAICVSELDSSVTYVVPLGITQEELQWEKEENKTHILVHPQWIQDCYKFWHKFSAKVYALNRRI